jgi:hypothetical protein
VTSSPHDVFVRQVSQGQFVAAFNYSTLFFFFLEKWLSKTRSTHASVQDVHNVEVQIDGEIDQVAPYSH